MKISSEEFCTTAIACNLDPIVISSTLKNKYPTMDLRLSRIMSRMESLRKKGLLPLDSGNSVSVGERLIGSSTLYDSSGNIKQQWVKTDVTKEKFLEAFNEAISDLSNTLPILPTAANLTSLTDDQLATVYISNDIHLGAYVWGEEAETDWSLDIAAETLRSAYDHLFAYSPNSKVGIVIDLGDITETDDYKNMTPKSGNILDVDSRYPKILRTAYEALIYAINKALEKHEIVYFYNIAGNHDSSTGVAIREVVRVAFSNNPRVIVDDSPKNIKYHQHGTTLLGFAHGDNMKMLHSGEVMASDCQNIFSSTTHRFFHLG